MPGSLLAMTALATLALSTSSLAQHAAHEHGVAQLDVAVDPGQITVSLQTPLDNLVGFEHAPQTATQRADLATALAQLRDPAQWLRIDPAGRCSVAAAEVSGPPDAQAHGAQKAEEAEEADQHAEISVQVTWRCTHPAAWLEPRLFAAFPRLQQIRLQQITPNSQTGRTLTRPDTRLSLAAPR